MLNNHLLQCHTFNQCEIKQFLLILVNWFYPLTVFYAMEILGVLLKLQY